FYRDQRYVAAIDATHRAREVAQRAIGTAQQSGNNEQNVARLVDEAAQMLEHAVACAGDSPTETQRRLLDLAQQQLASAREALQAMRWEIARGLAAQVVQTSRVICGGAAGGPGGRPAGGPGGGFASCDRVEQMLENVLRLQERALQDVPADDEQGRRMLDQASQLLDHARDSLQQGRCDPAFAQTVQARDLILRALRAHEGEPDPATVERAIDETSRSIDEVSGRIPPDNQAARTLLDNATRHLQRAREQAASQHLRPAVAEARVARNLAWRAARVAGAAGF